MLTDETRIKNPQIDADRGRVRSAMVFADAGVTGGAGRFLKDGLRRGVVSVDAPSLSTQQFSSSAPGAGNLCTLSRAKPLVPVRVRC